MHCGPSSDGGQRPRDEVMPFVPCQCFGPRPRLGHQRQPLPPLAERELVAQTHADHLGSKLVIAVRANSRHGQGTRELGRSHHADHCANLPHSSTVSSSARASGRMPARAKASGSTTPAKELRSILRRCPNPAFTTAARRSYETSSSGTAGSSRRSLRTSTDSTLGRGMKTDAETLPTTDDRAK